jgi:acyl carrier protein
MPTDTHATLLDLVREAIPDSHRQAVVEAGARLREDLGIDSIAAMTLALDVEERLGVVVSNEELAGLRTVADLIQLAEARCAA